MSTFQIDTATSRANPTPAPMKRLTVPAIRAAKGKTPVVVLTAYTIRMAQILDPHCDMLLVGDSLGQVLYGLPSSVPVSLDMMIAHGAAVVRGSYHSLVVVDMPFGSYEESPEQAFRSAARVLKETGAAAVKLEGGAAMAETIAFLTARGIPVVGHVGLTPQAVNVLGGYGARGRGQEEYARLIDDAKAVAQAGAFSLVVEGVVEPLAIEMTRAIDVPTIGIGGSVECDGQVLVIDDMLGMFDRVPRFVKKYEQLSEKIDAAVATYAADVRERRFPTVDQTYQPRK
ncbi:3-methyl-2-oxobutanoate hydroxymethyltransferase [Sphingomonas histidinilytica]|uniref:3-methyl-2-oxobutanoate hydroxymethyltransferase n=1 Tax=Rhizorhabdus histidinilytica TaxID=439228 RepID=A0A1T5DEG8_9SPHN|nr:3-methyl-2-oxobutanoate hydroxymethyltransferase [Rhizorhabdus histidinilytica]MBO9379391.1 3-methyl-2-oxobutanoate hydroxymethyltransferase [Rhizorhabdus histidinilytica]SKB69987.1 ketopantoate hydroxymethyltransferase [Rhizorhabdus histidinilytica]